MGNEWLNILSKFSQARKETPPGWFSKSKHVSVVDTPRYEQVLIALTNTSSNINWNCQVPAPTGHSKEFPSPAGFGHHCVDDRARWRVDRSTSHVSSPPTGTSASSSSASRLHSVLAMLEETRIDALLDNNEGQFWPAKDGCTATYTLQLSSKCYLWAGQTHEPWSGFLLLDMLSHFSL